MMVIFVSQCEKKALKRTRRVLDSFANRIGDNTWQTVITEEGLSAVKKLLRKNASKSTAVSCHWMRSRTRTELIWTAGNKRKFNSAGVVPVNYTNQEVIMDISLPKTETFLANTKEQNLSHHLFAVGYLAYFLVSKMRVDNEKLANAAYLAGIFHDLGKLDPSFQSWVKKKTSKTEDEQLPEDGFHIDKSVTGYSKFSFDKHPRHHEISWLLSESLLEEDQSLNNAQKNQIMHSVFWHHTRPFRKDESYFSSSEGIYKVFNKSLKGKNGFKEIYSLVLDSLSDIQGLAKVFESDSFKPSTFVPAFNSKFSLTSKALPKYKNYSELSDEFLEYTSDVKENALNNILRTAVISADRIVSAMSNEDLKEYLAEGTLLNALDDINLESTGLESHIRRCTEGFEKKFPNSERNKAQAAIVEQLVGLKEIAKFDEIANIGVLQGPAGCGKTKIALEWARNSKAQKIVWICPRVQVCLGLLNDLTQRDYLPDAKVEIFTGEFKHILNDGKSLNEAEETQPEDYLSGDIVITTIDQVVNNIISHSKVTLMVDFMQSHIVFDEFHELIPMPAFNLLFSELIECKKLQKEEANTLLVSATPNDLFVTDVLGINEKDIYRIDSFNQSDYRLTFQTYNDKEEGSPLINQSYDDACTFVISNTAIDAQLGFLKHQDSENNILIHSKYTKKDKVKWFTAVLESFKKEGDRNYQVLRSGPIVQASLNISCDRMVTELTNPENWLQRLGRLDRFGKNGQEPNQYITIEPESSISGKNTSGTSKFLKKLFSWHSTVAWMSFLKERIEPEANIKLNDVYSLYQAFYKDTECREMVAQDLLLGLKESVQRINANIIDPISVSLNQKKLKGPIKASKHSLRGNNRFVQMAVCNVNRKLEAEFINEYAYSESTDHSLEVIGLSESVEKIRGYGDSEKDLLAFMQKKHHNIKDDAKKAYNDSVLLGLARSPETPIYLSYTPDDLAKINAKPDKFAVYYIQSEKQPVGVMSLNRFSETKN